MDQCPKCSGDMDEGQVSVGEDLRYVSQRQKGMVRQPTPIVKAKACMQCGYIELYLDPAILKRKLVP
jgi:predicted nucleic-acid-binding Zn-ribbon protein